MFVGVAQFIYFHMLIPQYKGQIHKIQCKVNDNHNDQEMKWMIHVAHSCKYNILMMSDNI